MDSLLLFSWVWGFWSLWSFLALKSLAPSPTSVHLSQCNSKEWKNKSTSKSSFQNKNKGCLEEQDDGSRSQSRALVLTSHVRGINWSRESSSVTCSRSHSGDTSSQEPRDSSLYPAAPFQRYSFSVSGVWGVERWELLSAPPDVEIRSSWPKVPGNVPRRRCWLHRWLFQPSSSWGSLVCSKATFACLLLKSLFTLKRKKKKIRWVYSLK